MRNPLKAGHDVPLPSPYGAFVLGDDHDCQIRLLAAGSGLAPIRALTEALLAENLARKMTLFFSARTTADTIDHERFQDWRRMTGFR